MRRQRIFVGLIAAAAFAGSICPASAWWQFVANGPHGERQVSPHFNSQQECKSALKVTETVMAKKYPDRYPLVGSCEEYRFEHDRNFE